MRTAYIYDPLFLRHDTGSRHPEHSARLTAAQSLLEQQPWYGDLHQLSASPASLESIGRVHTSEYVERVRAACAAGQRRLDTPDVTISRESCEVALNAAGSILIIADAVLAKRVDNGFAMVRPPGHHAETALAMGFCLFNNIAIAARHLQKTHGLERILILDWDVHHGNGTQHIFEEDPDVFYISLHQFPHYPGTGGKNETGVGKGIGATLNCPMTPGLGDEHYRQAFDEIILPKARAFHPETVLISAGFDAHRADPLADINLTTRSYRWMTRAMMDLADQCCEGRIISILEGGYDLNALAASVSEHLRMLAQAEAHP